MLIKQNLFATPIWQTNLEKEFNSIKEEISEIKQLLLKVINKRESLIILINDVINILKDLIIKINNEEINNLIKNNNNNNNNNNLINLLNNNNEQLNYILLLLPNLLNGDYFYLDTKIIEKIYIFFYYLTKEYFLEL